MSELTKRARALAATILLGCNAGAPSWAEAPTEDQSEVVVVAPRADPDAEISNFVRGHARLSRIDQLARWRDPVCVRVINLPQGFSRFISDRIAAVAREAGAPAASNGAECAPNVTIVFTSEPQVMLDRVRSDNSELLGFHFIHRRNALATMTKPIQAWYVTGTDNGVATYRDESMRNPPDGTPGSRITGGLQSVFMHVLVLVDANKVADAPVGPIADYLAVLSLTEIRDEAWTCGGLVTIMEHFSGCPDAPQSLTSADRAFLRGLYTMDGRYFGSLQRGQIRKRMSDMLRDEASREGQERR